jgi:hypothetical protein
MVDGGGREGREDGGDGWTEETGGRGGGVVKQPNGD